MQIWDTAGQERFRAMAPMYYRNAAVAVVCFDIMDEDSFQKMKDWVEELRTNIPEGKIVLAIACNKVRSVMVLQGEALAFSSSSSLLLFRLLLSDIADCNQSFTRILLSRDMVRD